MLANEYHTEDNDELQKVRGERDNCWDCVEETRKDWHISNFSCCCGKSPTCLLGLTV